MTSTIKVSSSKNTQLHQYSSTSSKGKELTVSKLIPITQPFRDKKGRVIRLWEVPGFLFYGTVQHLDGKTTIISSNKYYQPVIPRALYYIFKQNCKGSK